MEESGATQIFRRTRATAPRITTEGVAAAETENNEVASPGALAVSESTLAA